MRFNQPLIRLLCLLLYCCVWLLPSVPTARADNADDIRAVYQEMMLRAPTDAELNNYLGAIQLLGWTLLDIRTNLVNLNDHNHNSVTDPVDVRTAYREVLGRDPNPAEVNYYVELINTREWPVEIIRNHLLSANQVLAQKVNAAADEFFAKQEQYKAEFEQVKNTLE